MNPVITLFHKALEVEAHEASYQQLGKVLIMQEAISGALTTFHQALDHTPESSDTLCQIGLLHLRQGKTAELANLNKMSRYCASHMQCTHIQTKSCRAECRRAARSRVSKHAAPTPSQGCARAG